MRVDGIMLFCESANDSKAIIDALKRNKRVVFRIDYPKSVEETYTFAIDCEGFAELFDSVDW